jgi:hypothetical protein
LSAYGKCPKCEKPVTHCTFDDVGVDYRLMGSHRGLALCCPHCRTVLGVSPDPDVLVGDVAYRLLHKLANVSQSQENAIDVQRALSRAVAGL